MRNIITFLILITCFSHSFSRNEGMPIIKNFKAETYEGGSRIYSIVCTKDGLLYAGDKSGILEFDGENWNKIECGFAVTSLAVDSSNVVYVAGNKGIGKLAVDSANIIGYTSLNHFITTEKSLRKFRFSKVFNIQERIIYVLGKEIVINTPESLRIIETPHNFNYYQKLDDELYFYSQEDGVYQLIGNKLTLINGNELIKNKNIRGFLNFKNQIHVLIGDEGVYNLELNTMSSLDNLMKELNLKQIQGVDQIDDSTYALKTYYNGVLLFNSNGDILKKYHYEEGLVNNTVFTVFKDYWNNLWIGTASGISVIRQDFPFTKINNLYGIGTGYGAALYKGSLYYATSQGLYVANTDDQGHYKFTKVFDGHVWGLHVIDNVLYFGCPSGVYSWNNQKAKRISFYPGAWYMLNIPNNPNYYITGTPLGINLLKKGEDGYLKHVRLLEGLNANIKNIEVDKELNFWAEHNKGIYTFKINKELTQIENLNSFDRIETNNKIRKIRKLNEDLLFIADSGIYYKKLEGNFERHPKFNRFIETKEYPSNIVVDKYDRFWVFSNGKLSCYSIKNDKLKKFYFSLIDFADQKYPPDYENIFSIDSNLVIIGQEEGFLGYDLSLKYSGTFSSNRIRKVIVKSKKGSEQNLKGDIELVNMLQHSSALTEFKHRSSVKFYYSAGCGKYNSVKYSTFLQGFDKEWTSWSSENIKEYTNLPKGEYKFVVRSINKSNEESTPAVYDFKILAPWYLTLAAKIGYILCLLILGFIIERLIQIRANKIKSKIQKEQDEILYRKEQKQIQEELKRQQELIKLRNEKLRIDNLYKSKELANSTMGVIKKNQFLTDLKEELEKIREYAEKNKLVTGDIKDVIKKINRDIDNEENWKVFEDYFDRVHEKFLKRMKDKYPILTSKDLRLSAYLRMNLSTKEIAPLMNITVRGVEISRYRLRKKLELDRNENLNDYLLKF